MVGDPRQVVRRYYDEVFAAHDLAALDKVIAPDFVGHSTGYGDFTIDDMRRDIAREFEAMPEDEVIVEEQLVDGDRVVTRWRYRWKHDRSLFGERPSGRWLEMDGVHIDRIVGDKIVERWELKDFWGVVQRLGGQVVMAQEETAPPASEEAG